MQNYNRQEPHHSAATSPQQQPLSPGKKRHRRKVIGTGQILPHLRLMLILGALVTLIWLGVYISNYGDVEAAPDRSSPPAMIVQDEVDWEEIDLVLRTWDEIHHYVDQHWDATPLPKVLTGSALTEQREVIRILQEKNCRWQFTDLAEPTLLERQEISATEVMVTMQKHWDANLYCNGALDRGSFDEPFIVRYRILRTSDGWRIERKEVLER
jgi:hypothetical protein